MQSENTSSIMRKFIAGALLSGLLCSGGFGCAGAAVGAAGAAGAIAYTERGAKGAVKGKVQQVDQRAKDTFKDMGIAVTKTESKDSGKERELSGKSGAMEVTVSMERSTGDTTQVEVVAREGTLKWNKDYAKNVLSKIIHRG